MINNNDTYASQVTQISKFRIMSKEAKTNVIKTIILKDFFGEYIQDKVDNIKSDLTEEEKIAYKEEIENIASQAVDTFLEDILSEDKELKNRIFGSFIKSYSITSKIVKEGICKNNHTYSNFREVKGIIPQYDINGNFISYANGVFYERECTYCGKKEIVFSNEEKTSREEDSNNKKLSYVLDNKNKENS